MQPADLFVELRKYLHPSDASVILMALKSEPLVWKTLLDPETSALLINEHYPHAISWSPAALALRIMGSKIVTAELATDSLQALDNSTRKKALDAFETVLRSGEPVQTLAEAGLVALALRERRRKTHTWVGLADELKSLAVRGQDQLALIWQTPLACLYSIIPDSDKLLQALMSSDLHPGMEWATHMILSNPVQPDFQIEALKKVLQRLPLGQQVEWLRYLNKMGRQTILRSLAADLLIENRELNRQPLGELDFSKLAWEDLSALALKCEAQATLHEFAGHPAQAAIELESARQILHNWLSGTTMQLISLTSKDGPVDVKLWDECQQISSLHPLQEEIQAETFFLTKNTSTNPFLSDSASTKNLLLGRVFQASRRALTGNRREAQEAAREAINYWIGQAKRNPSLLSGQYVFDFQISPLMNALVELGLIKEAIEVGQLFANVRPEDLDLMVAVSDLFHRVGNHEIALNYIYQVILEEPEAIQPHRILANYLEECKSWKEALDERKMIVELTSANPLEDTLALAQCALGGKFFDETIQVCEHLLEKEPGLGMAWTYLGMAYAGQNSLEDALACLSKATLLNPENSVAWAQLADLHKRNGDLQRCMETLRSAILTAPDSAELHYALGRAYLESRSPSEALPFLRQSARLAPESDSVALALVETLFSLGHEHEALNVIEKARQRWPVEAGLAYQHARILISRGEKDEGLATLEVALQSATPEPEWFVDYAAALIGPPENIWGLMTDLPEFAVIAKAQRALQRALNIAPEHFEARLMLAEILALRQEPEAAYAAYHHLVEMDQASMPKFYWRIQAGLGFVASRLGQYETALASFQNAANARPELMSLQRALAETYFSVALNDCASQAAESALALAPDQVANLEWYAGLMERIGEAERGIHALETAGELDPQNVAILIKLAGMHIHSGNQSKAEAALLQALSMENVTPQDLRNVANAAMHLENQALALNALEKAVIIATNPSDELQYELAHLYQVSGEKEKALAAIQSALVIEPDRVDYYLLQADLQQESHRSQAALASLEHALRLQESTVGKDIHEDKTLFEIHVRFANLLEKSGNLSSALYHAEKAISICNNVKGIRYLAVDLAARLLQNERAANLLAGIPQVVEGSCFTIYTATNENDWQAGLSSYQALQAWNKGDLKQAGKFIEQGLAFKASDMRLLAVQAMLMNCQGDAEGVQKFLAEAFASLQISLGNGENRLDSRALAFGEAAAACFEWDAALQVFTEYLNQHPDEPLALLSYGRALVRAAEWQPIGRALAIQNHIASTELITPEVYARFDQVMMDLKKAGCNADADHWRDRGEMIFQPASNRNHSIEPKAVSSEDAPWVVAAMAQAGLNQAIYPLTEKYPDNAVLQMIAAWSALPHDSTAATIWAQHAVELAPFDPIGQVILALCTQAKNDYSEAYEALLAAVNIWPDEAEWQFLAGQLAAECQETSVSIAHYEQAVQLNARNLGYQNALGHAYMNSHAYGQAIETFNTITRAEPEKEEGWVCLAQAYNKAGQYKQAYSAAEQALRINTKSVPALVLCGEISLQYNPAKALEFIRQAQALAPNDPDCRLLSVRILIQRGKEKEALAELTQAVAEIPDSVELNLERARLLYKLEGANATLPVLKSLAIQFPQDDRIAAFLAKVFVEIGNLSQAEKAGLQALKLNSNQPEIQLLLGKVYHETGQLDKSIYHLAEAVKHSAHPIEALLEMGKAYSDRREFQNALVMYQKAIEANGEDYRAYYQAALVMRDGKDYPGAESMLRKAAQLCPDDVNIRRQLGAIVALNLVQTCQEANSCQ